MGSEMCDVIELAGVTKEVEHIVDTLGSSHIGLLGKHTTHSPQCGHLASS